jgi:alkylation response protein AidB-like acyl-CoA dehydrogenase
VASVPVLSPDQVLLEARDAANNIASGLAFAVRVGAVLPQPGEGHTQLRWSILAAAGQGDLTAARILEAHSDALAILNEAHLPIADGTWGVFAAEAPGVRLDAHDHGDTAVLTGTKPWCSLGGQLDHALVTAHSGDQRRLYAVPLQHPTVTADPPSRWVARGLAAVTSGPVHFAGTPAQPVGAPGWYLERSGFAWGGMGVAACWYGGALGLYQTLVEASRKRSGDLTNLHVGTVDVALHAAAATLHAAAEQVDAGTAAGAAGAVLALRVRSVVAAAVEATLSQVGHALGPAPLAFDEQHARRVADLELYVRQHHAERDLAALGASILGDEAR